MKNNENANDSNKVKVELSSGLLSELIVMGMLHGSDCICLDAQSKKIMWQSLLSTSIKI